MSTVGAVVMIAGAGIGDATVSVLGASDGLFPAEGKCDVDAAVGWVVDCVSIRGIGGRSSRSACILAVAASCVSEKWRHLNMLNLRVAGLACCSGGECGRSMECRLPPRPAFDTLRCEPKGCAVWGRSCEVLADAFAAVERPWFPRSSSSWAVRTSFIRRSIVLRRRERSGMAGHVAKTWTT